MASLLQRPEGMKAPLVSSRGSNRATRSWSRSQHAGTARSHLVLAVVLAVSPGPVVADELPGSPELVFVPAECLLYWSVPGGKSSPAAWNQVLSFAACIQDASIARIDDPRQLPELVVQFEAALAPSVQLYTAALELGPRPIQLRAAYQIGMSQVALITRARASIVVPPDRATNPTAAARYRALVTRLDTFLERPATLAWTLFVLIDRATTIRELKKELRWNEVYHHLARGL